MHDQSDRAPRRLRVNTAIAHQSRTQKIRMIRRCRIDPGSSNRSIGSRPYIPRNVGRSFNVIQFERYALLSWIHCRRICFARIDFAGERQRSLALLECFRRSFTGYSNFQALLTDRGSLCKYEFLLFMETVIKENFAFIDQTCSYVY